MTDPTTLFSLDSLTIYNYYNFPLSWITKDETSYYFATFHSCCEHQGRDWESYCFIPLSEERLQLFENNKIDRYTLFKESELDYVYLCTVYYQIEKDIEGIKKVNVQELPYEQLPEPGVYLA